MVSIILFTPLVAGSCIIDNSHTLLSVFLISGTFCSASSSSPSSFRKLQDPKTCNDHQNSLRATKQKPVKDSTTKNIQKLKNLVTCSHPFRRVIFHREKSIYRGISSRLQAPVRNQFTCPRGTFLSIRFTQKETENKNEEKKI